MDPSLYEAATSGDVGFLRKKIRDGGASIDLLHQKTPKDNNILHISAEFKQIDFFKDVDPDQFDQLFWATNKKGDTPLHVASRVGCHEIAKLLIQQAKKTLHQVERGDGESGPATNKKGDTPLHVASRVGCHEIVKLLIQQAKKTLHHVERGDEESGPADGESQNKLLRVTNSDNDTVLHLAVRYNHEEIVILLMEADPQLCCITNKAKESPLFLAVRKRSPSIAHRILQSDISPSFQGTNGLTALHLALTQEQLIDKGVVEIMMSKNQDIIREVDAIGWTPLHYAAYTGNIEATQLLVKCDSSICYMLDNSKMSALHVAAYAGHTQVMEELIRCRPDTCDLLNSKGQTALHLAVLGGQRGVVEYILKTSKLAGLINEADEEGNTPLHIAVIYKKVEIITILTSDPQVDRNAINKELLTAIDIFLGQGIEEQETIDSPFLQRLGSSVGGSFFQQKISDDFNKRQSPSQVHSDQASKRDGTKLVVATLVATVTFTAAITPPGGIKSDGTPVLFENSYFKAFQVFNKVSFLLAILAICNESTPIRLGKIEIATPARLILSSIVWLLMAFVLAVYAMTPKRCVSSSFACAGPLDIILTLVAVPLYAVAIIPWAMSVYRKVGNRGSKGNRVI